MMIRGMEWARSDDNDYYYDRVIEWLMVELLPTHLPVVRTAALQLKKACAAAPRRWAHDPTIWKGKSTAKCARALCTREHQE
jgi:hypothetical protein